MCRYSKTFNVSIDYTLEVLFGEEFYNLNPIKKQYALMLYHKYFNEYMLSNRDNNRLRKYRGDNAGNPGLIRWCQIPHCNLLSMVETIMSIWEFLYWYCPILEDFGDEENIDEVSLNHAIAVYYDFIIESRNNYRYFNTNKDSVIERLEEIDEQKMIF